MKALFHSEWVKLSTLRVSRYVLLTVALTLTIGAVIALAMVSDWDSSSAEEQAMFGAGEPNVVVIPMMQFCLGLLGALMITSEFASAMITNSLIAVPQRTRLMIAKCGVGATIAFIIGSAVCTASLVAGHLITGDRPSPISTWTSWSDGFALVAGNAFVMTVITLLGLAVGTVLRSTAGSVIALVIVLFVAPVLATVLPFGWADEVGPFLLTNLPQAIAGTDEGAALSPAAAICVAFGYIAIVVPVALLTLNKRDV